MGFYSTHEQRVKAVLQHVDWAGLNVNDLMAAYRQHKMDAAKGHGDFWGPAWAEIDAANRRWHMLWARANATAARRMGK